MDSRRALFLLGLWIGGMALGVVVCTVLFRETWSVSTSGGFVMGTAGRDLDLESTASLEPRRPLPDRDSLIVLSFENHRAGASASHRFHARWRICCTQDARCAGSAVNRDGALSIPETWESADSP
jgi:hypothetical protein